MEERKQYNDGDTELVDAASEVLDEGPDVVEGCSEVLGCPLDDLFICIWNSLLIISAPR